MASNRLLLGPPLDLPIRRNEANRRPGHAPSAWIEQFIPATIRHPGRTASSDWIEQFAPEKIAPKMLTMEKDNATLSDPSRDVTPNSPPVTFPARDPLKPSFPTVIVPALFPNFTTGEIIDVDDIHKLRHSHLVYCDNLDSMPFLRGKGNIPFKHAKVKTLPGNIEEIFGDTAPTTAPTELDLHLYKYTKNKSFWAVKIGAKYVMVKGGGALWRPWLGPEEGFHWLGVASAIGVDAGETYESKKKAKKERREANRAARAALKIKADGGMEKATSEAGTTEENGDEPLENSVTMATDGAGTVESSLALQVDGSQAEKDDGAPIVKKRGRKATRKSTEPAGTTSLDLGLGAQEPCEENTMTRTTFRVNSAGQTGPQHVAKIEGDVTEEGGEGIEAN
jgi:hypothetical protein